MKILFITDLYPIKSEEKTTPRTLFNFVKSWKNFGHEIEIIKPNFLLNSFIRRKPFYKNGIYDGVLNLNYQTPFWFDISRKIRTGITNFSPKNYDLVIAHMPCGILFADRLGVPFVAGVHNSDLTILTKPLYRFHFKKRMENALKNAKAIACRSFALKEKLLKIYPEFEEKTFVAPSGIDENLIEENLEKFSTPKIKIVTCANYKKYKNIELVLTATKAINGIELTIIGKGTDTKKLKNLNPHAKFLGYQPKEKVLDLMRQSDVFILPSKGETFGMVYLEAMASGCITICSEHDGIDGIIKNGENGFTVVPSVTEIKNILNHIKNMTQNERKLLIQNGFQTIRQYTADKCAQDYLQQIFKVM